MVTERLETRLANVTSQLRSLLKMLEALRRTQTEPGSQLKDNQFYCKTLRSSGKLSCELTHRLDTIRDLVSEDEFDSLVRKLGCTWDSSKSRAVVN